MGGLIHSVSAQVYHREKIERADPAHMNLKKGVKVWMLKFVPTTALILSVAMGGVAFTASAAANTNKSGAQSWLYKNATPKAHARPNSQSVKPGAKLNEPWLYKSANVDAHARPNPQSVDPSAKLSQPWLYKSATVNAHARPNPQSVASGAKLRQQTLSKDSQHEAQNAH